jgi:hypothetical protein
MDVRDEGLLEIWRAFSECNLKYIMVGVGGFAVNLHSFTGDVDVWIKDTKGNRLAFRKVLNEPNSADLPQIETIDFVPG